MGAGHEGAHEGAHGGARRAEERPAREHRAEGGAHDGAARESGGADAERGGCVASAETRQAGSACVWGQTMGQTGRAKGGLSGALTSGESQFERDRSGGMSGERSGQLQQGEWCAQSMHRGLSRDRGREVLCEVTAKPYIQYSEKKSQR